MARGALHLPTMSIVTPNYNGADHLQACLNSVIDQQIQGLEYVVVDGGSTDGSGPIVTQFSDQLASAIIEPDTGHANALNKGFAQTTGEIMGWINSDDLLFDGSLAFVQRLFAAYPEIEWITGRASSMNAAGEVMHILPARPWSRLRMLCGDHAFIQQESTFWRRSLWERTGAGLDESLTVANDFELWMRFFREAELHTVDRHLGCFRVRPGQRSVVEAKRYRSESRQVIARELAALEPGFRAAFADILPETPVELSDEALRSQSHILAACDPPILKASAVNKRAHLRNQARATPTEVKGPAPAHTFAPSDLSALRDKHAGERCFILGNGPSLNSTDLSCLKDETVFGCNGVFLLFDRIDWRPTYYTCVDSRVLPDRAADIRAMLDAEPQMTGFFPTRLDDYSGLGAPEPARALITDGPNRLFFNQRVPTTANLPWSMFSPDPGAYLVQPQTVTITMMQLAAFMGFSELVLLGCDTTYQVSSSVEREASLERPQVALTSTHDDDLNHFDPRYFGAGRRWHVPDLNAMVTQYQHARTALEAQGVRVFNATVGGELEVFERLDLEDAVRRPRTSERTPRPAGAGTAQARARPKAPSRLMETVRNNRTAMIGAGLAALAAAAVIAVAPGGAVKLALAASGLGLGALGLAALVTLKTRRIVLNLIKRIESYERESAKREITLIEMSARVDELEYQRLEQDRPAEPRRRADAG
jgi:hypothetical protein